MRVSNGPRSGAFGFFVQKLFTVQILVGRMFSVEDSGVVHFGGCLKW